ncbi:unnamed protein product [Ascophyllum nodosum]
MNTYVMSRKAILVCLSFLLIQSDSLLIRPPTHQATARLQLSSLSASPCHSQANKRGASLMAAPKEGKKLKEFTLVFCRRTSSSSVDDGCNELLLGLKKQGFGEGKWNGFGGKLEAGETVEEAAKRELLEESGVIAQRLSLRGQLTFNVPSYSSIMRVFVYEAVSYVGEPRESEEMRPRWFRETDLPFKEMWADDEHWMPLFLAGKFFQGEFNFSDEQTIIDYKLRDLPSAETIQEIASTLNV